jgi:3'(2'), 5'-bisphosphate nucleotidase
MDVLGFAGPMRSALYQCGQVARALKGMVATEHKAPDSAHQQSTTVSVVDRLCQEIVLLRAHDVSPGIEVYSEELASCPRELLELFARNRSRYLLVLDPLDGTDDFLQGKDTYGHMLGLLDQDSGYMACGLIYFPERGRLYVGLRGMGAFMVEGLWGTPVRLQPGHPGRTVGQVKRLEPRD